MATREEKIKEIERLRKINKIQELRASQEADKAQPVNNSIKPEQSALYGAAQSATFGFADEGLAAAKAVKDKVTKGGSLGDLYRTRVDKERQTFDEARRQNPGSYLAGEVAGSIPTMAIPGLGIAKGASLGGSLLKAGAQGALMAAGESRNNPTDSPEALDGLGKDIAKGAVVGGVSQLAFRGVGGLLEKITPSALRKTAEERAVKATTGQNISALRKMAGTTLNSAGDVQKAEAALRKKGRDLLDEGVVGAFNTVEDLAPKLAKGREKYGKLIGEIGDKIDEAVPNAVDGKSIANKLVAYAETIPPTEGGKNLQNRILAEAANFEKLGGLTFKDAQAFKNQFKFKPVDADALISNQDATNKIRSIIGKQMDETVEIIAAKGPDETKNLLKQYAEAKGKYGTFKSASDAATDRVQKNLSNRFVSPSDYGAGATAAILSGVATGGAGLSSAALGALAAMGNKFARTRGSATAAATTDTIASVLEKSPAFAKQFGELIIDAANRGPAALVATHRKLMDDPEYKKNFRDENADRQMAALKRRLGQ